MKTPFDHFKEKIRLFQPTLEGMGYQLKEIEEVRRRTGGVTMEYHFVRGVLELWIGTHWDSERGAVIWTFSMFDKNPRRDFFLDYFVEDFGIEALKKGRITNLSEVEKFFEDFFNELKRGAETYLKDQLTGVVFHDHRLRSMQEYYDSFPAQELLANTTHRLLRENQGPLLLQWFWRLVYLLFPSFPNGER